MNAVAAVTTPATCEEMGQTTYTGASFGNEAFTVQTKVLTNIDALGHNEEILPAVTATCTETGLTEGKRCSTCGEILSTEAIPSRFPIYYLYTGIAFIAVIAIAAFVLLFKATKNGVKKGKKIA